MLSRTATAFAFVFGLLVFLGGAVALGIGAVGDGVWAVLVGSAIMIACALQRGRYRPHDAERLNPDAGPGGGEPGFLEPRFAPTNEVFVDPTSHRLMRVYFDARTGERRYRAQD
jgi:hypothetical protein